MIDTIDGLMNTMLSNQVSIPLIEPMLDMLQGIPLVGYIIALVLWKPFFAIVICPGLTVGGLSLLFFPWIERKLCARIQWRVGPHEIVWWLGGVIQILADALRFLFQEVIVHKDAHKSYFLQFPFLTFIAFLLPLLFIPAGNIVAIQTPYGMQIVLLLICLFPLFVMGLGWASNSRFAYIGTVREAFMYFAEEVPFIIAALAMIILYKTSDLMLMASKQFIPGAILNPIAALAFFIAAAMATARLPFEIAESDQELCAGPHVEYSGIAFGLIYVLCYEKGYVISGLMTVLFLGGGAGPAIPGLGDLSGAFWFILKTYFVMTTLFVLRAIYPRYRIDQGLKIGWSPMLIMALIALALSLVEVAVI
jgi:NADH-quinone oxidoreductase subunit H